MSDLSTASWRDSARSTRLWIFNSSNTFPLLLWLFDIKRSTFVFALLVLGFFSVIEYYGFTPEIFLRLVRSTLAGRRRFARPWWMT